ncbi:unnamed protein product [Polarella glacialis]|uniref:Pentatricopeptide repeat-containing protein n=1 Tax=Polarella glacialis TaxID=89957 RepID=A0A813H8H7_POLGL|nr:unnamed protein product [Polarella glacialis]
MVAAFKCRFYADGVNIYKRLCNAGPPKTAVTYAYALKLFSKAERQGDVTDIITEVWKNVVKPDAPLFGAMIDAVAEAGKANEAIELLDTMRSHNLVPDVIAWGSAVNACKNARNSTVARFLLDFMIKEGVKPTCIVFTNVVSAHCGSRLVLLQKLKSDMVRMDIKADAFFVGAYVAALLSIKAVSLGSASEAVDLISDLDSERLTEMALVVSEARADQIRLTRFMSIVEVALQRTGFG